MGEQAGDIKIAELAVEIAALRELVKVRDENAEKLRQETNARYEQRFASSETAVAAALSAQKEATASAFAASEKAIVKAEIAQQNYNDRSNEFRAALDDSNKSNIGRNEADTRFNGLDSKVSDIRTAWDKNDKELRQQIADLRESRSAGAGRSGGSASTIAYIVTAISVFGGLVAIFFALSGR